MINSSETELLRSLVFFFFPPFYCTALPFFVLIFFMVSGAQFPVRNKVAALSWGNLKGLSCNYMAAHSFNYVAALLKLRGIAHP